MRIYKATKCDIEDLIQLRIDFLKMEYPSISPQEEAAIRRQSESYFKKHIYLGDFICIIAKTDAEEIASAAFLIIQEKPANPIFISGLTGTVLNVITYPQYRRKGFATKVLHILIQEARDKGLNTIDLSATKDGEDLYKKLGFEVPKYTNMRFKL